MNTQRWILVLAAALIAVAGGFFLWQSRVVEVADPSPVGATPTRAEIDAMSSADRDALMTRMMDKAAAAPDRDFEEAMQTNTDQTPLVVATGRFRDGDAIHKGSGDILLYRFPDGRHVVRLENLAVTNGPALVVLLASAIDPRDARDVKRSYIKLADLKGNRGNQNYEIPASVNVGLYRSVVIWCDLFDVLFASATLNAT